MKARILLVDDEDKLLNALQRNLRKHYNITTVNNGPDALKLMKNEPAFEVVVTDMKMPVMDGIEFLTQAKKIAPDTIRVMLTGNSEQETAKQALNQGDVFKFLTKPCTKDEYINSIEQAIRQNRLLIAEKELLEKTLQGSIEVLVDILSLSNPIAFGHTNRLKKLVMEIVEQLKLPNSWQYKTAAMLSQIGVMILPPEMIHNHNRNVYQSEEEVLIQKHSLVAADLLDKIPRLESVSNVIRYQSKGYNGSGYPKDKICGERLPLGSRILKIANDFERLKSTGKNPPSIIDHLNANKELYDPNLLELLDTIIQPDITTKIVNIRINALKEGVTLAADIRTHQGTLILGEGEETSSTNIAKLRNYVASGMISDKILIRQNILT